MAGFVINNFFLLQTMFFLSLKGVKTRNKVFSSAQEAKLLTGLPDALWCMQGVTEDALMPEASKAMNHLSGPVQNHTLHLVFTAV